MEAAVKVIRWLQIALLVTIVLYAVAGEMLSRNIHRHAPSTLFHVFSLISISLVGAIVVVRRTLITPSEVALEQKQDSLAFSRWRTGYIALYALCEMLGLFGLVLRLAGFTLANVWGFYLGGIVLLLLYSPRAVRSPVR
jgi:hypothetical protein